MHELGSLSFASVPAFPSQCLRFGDPNRRQKISGIAQRVAYVYYLVIDNVIVNIGLGTTSWCYPVLTL